MPITCPHCSREFSGDKLNSRHIAVCNPSVSLKVDPCLCGHESTSLTQMKRHRQTCTVWGARDAQGTRQERMRRTSLERYGVECGAQAPEVVARREATVREKYGVNNPFQSEDVKARSRTTMLGRYGVEHNSHASESNEKRKATNLARRGVENPFAAEDVKEKIRETMLDRYGEVSPQHVPDIRAKTKATNEERYGGELLGSPVLRAKAETTNLGRYGAAFAGGTPEVQAKVMATNMARYGVPHTCMDPEVRRKQMETHHERYGKHWFASEEGKTTIREAMMLKYGVPSHMMLPGAWARLVAIFRETFGVDHPLQVPEILERRHLTNIERYGTPFPGLRLKGMNGLETRLFSLAPSPNPLLFTGDGGFWRWLPKLGHHKNPDFIVPGPDPAHPGQGMSKVVEVFGDFWHSRMFTGKAPFAHEQDLVDAYADVGIECLVVWESEVKSGPEGVQARLASFLDSGLEVADESRGGVFDLFG